MIDTLSTIDQSLFLLINSWNAAWLNPLMIFFSGQLIWIPFLVLIFSIAFKNLSRSSFYLFCLFLLLAIIASDVTSSYMLKNIFERLRPCRVEELKALINNFGQKCGGRYGFVSSHAANSIAIMVFAFLSLRLNSSKFLLLWLLPILVCYSRIYVGVHYPGDILGGVFVGSLWGYIMSWLFKNHTSWGKTA